MPLYKEQTSLCMLFREENGFYPIHWNWFRWLSKTKIKENRIFNMHNFINIYLFQNQITIFYIFDQYLEAQLLLWSSLIDSVSLSFINNLI